MIYLRNVEWTQIINDVKAGKFAPVYLLHGTEEYFIDQVAKAIEDEALSEGERDFNMDVLYGRDATADQVNGYVTQFPMMSERRLVILREAADFKQMDDILPILEKPVSSTVFLIVHKHKRMDMRKKAAIAVKHHGVILESKTIFDNKMPNWISRYILDADRKIDARTAVLIAEYLGNDLTTVVHELDKLILNTKSGDSITPELVELYIGISKVYNVFELQDAIASRNPAKALRIAFYFNDNHRKYPLLVTVASLASFFLKVYIVQQNIKLHNKELAPKIGLRHDFLVNKYRVAATNYPTSQIHKVFELLQHFDLRSKGVADTGRQAEGLTAELVERLLLIPKTAN